MAMKQMAAARPARAEISAFIAAELEKVNPQGIDITEETNITSDLQIDSLAIMDLMFAIEERFDVSIPLNDLADIRSVGELSHMVEKITTGNT